MTLHGLNNEQYQTGRVIGRGGEGQVFDIENHVSLVLKKYNEPLLPEKISKLKQMVAIHSPAIEAYAAWPVGIVTDNTGTICGFIMKKLSGYVPMHAIFSPMDRKKLFPDKGYNFLVHIARNLATAFHKLHEAGLVVGDVNEGNILINASGFVTFIDCDSFQVKNPETGGYFFCEVGVPRYTPPEILKKGTFEQVIRSVNTDSFSLAVLVFQLLFLGRHPFAGKNGTNKDIDEETAIRSNEFAYSLVKKRKKLTPPADSFSITNLSDPVIDLFHRAFEQKDRPEPAEWVQALDGLLNDMATCSLTKLHTYPSKLAECPWCGFRKTRGILYFLDDSYLQANLALSDIDSFVNGFKVEKLEMKKWDNTISFTNLTATPIEKQFYNYRHFIQISYIISVLAGIGLISFNRVFIIISFITPYIIWKYSSWRKKLMQESDRLNKDLRILKERQQTLIKEYNQPSDLEQYNKGLHLLNKTVTEFRNLPEVAEHRRRQMEEKVYNEQLTYYLACFKLENNVIPAIGEVKRTALISSGILSAADINKLQAIKVPGIGPKNYQVLLSWQRQVAQGFIYIPDAQKIAEGLQQVNYEISSIKTRLETTIRKEYQTINYLKNHITNRCSILERQLIDMAQKVKRAELDVAGFGKMTRVI